MIRKAAKILAIVTFIIVAKAHALDLHQPPEPLKWKTEPHARVSDSATMEAVVPNVKDSVEYRFVCKTGDALSSKWQTSPSYTASKLKPNTAYAFVAHARCDGKPIGLPSKEISVKTQKIDGDKNVAKIDDAIRKGRLENIPIMVNGDKDNRINIVFANRWMKGRSNSYNKPEMRDEYAKDCRNALKIFTAGDGEAIPPYPEYKNFLNLYAMWWPDVPAEDKKDPKNSMKRPDFRRIRDRLFLPWQRDGRGWVTLIGFPNSDARGGNACRIPERRTGDIMIVGNAPTGIIHEFNHTAPGIADEYTSSGMWGFGGEGSTITSEHRRNFCRWRAWIEPETPVPTPYNKKYLGKVGLHEGGLHRMGHHYRPTAQGCLMGAGSGNVCVQMCPVCRQRAVMRFYQWVDAIDARNPALEEITIPKACRMTFSVKRVHPIPDTQKTTWTLNGKIIASNTDSVEVDFEALDRYELTFSLVDESKYIRPDPPYSDYPRASTTWTILNPKAKGNSNQLATTIATVPPVFDGVASGSISISVTGGKAPYDFYWSDGNEGAERKNLGAGTYAVTIIDSEFRSMTKQVDLVPDKQFDPKIVSDFDGKGWTVTCPLAELGYVGVTWSTGEKTAAIQRGDDGVVTCVLLRPNGCTTTQTLKLKRPAKTLVVRAVTIYASSGGENNGIAVLDIEGGRKPFSFIWSDGVETNAPKRHYLCPGDYSVTVRDANGTEQACSVTIKSGPSFRVGKLKLERQGEKTVRIANADDSLEYLWFDRDLPGWLPRFPHGVYSGTYTSSTGQVCDAEAYVVQNKAGVYVKPDDRKRGHHYNDPGFWAHVMIWEDGRKKEPRLLKLNLAESTNGFTLTSAPKIPETGWTGTVIDGRMIGVDAANASGMFQMHYVSRPNEIDTPIAVGTSCKIPKPGQYFIAARKKVSGAISQNRLGVSIGATPATKTDPIDPKSVASAKMLMWLDASDIDGDGKTDDDKTLFTGNAPLRRGAMVKWQGKSNSVNFGGFIFYYPNTLNGLGVASWKTIWVQGLKERPKDFQTIIMIRCEHDLSWTGAAPWKHLNSLIGIGEYGERLFSDEAAKSLEKSRVFVDGYQVDPKSAKMPADFYVATYEFDTVIDKQIASTDGHWEGSVAECLVFDGKLSDADRRGLEEYLRRKWLSAVDLSFNER